MRIKSEDLKNKTKKEDLIKKVLDMELEMFLAVRSVEPTKCQENPNAFKLMRGAGFETWSNETLVSYLEDLNKAKQEGINFMTLKYARMGNQIECLNDSSIIDYIIGIEEEFQQQFKEKYPHLTAGKEEKARIYLKSELETYSDKTLELYHDNLLQSREEGRNLVEESYFNIFKKLGYSSLEEAEEKRKLKKQKI